MPGLLPNIDPDGLLEYSVVYTDRSLNHMSGSFQQVMNDVSSSLKTVYSNSFGSLYPIAYPELINSVNCNSLILWILKNLYEGGKFISPSSKLL